MKLSKNKTLLILGAATIATGIWFSTHPKTIQVDCPKTIALLVGITLGGGVIWAYLARGYHYQPVAQIRLKPRLNIFQTAALAFLLVLITSIGFGSMQAQPSRTMANDSGKQDESTGNACPVDSTKLNFMASCDAHLTINALESAKTPQNETNREICRCIALNFPVERIFKPGSTCNFTPDMAAEIMRIASVRLKCL